MESQCLNFNKPSSGLEMGENVARTMMDVLTKN